MNDSPLRIWAVHCPFRKDGSPVIGGFGSIIRPIVIIDMDTWTELCKRVPQLQTMKFDVGVYEDSDNG